MRAFIPAFRLALDIVQTRTKPYQAEVVNEHRQSLIFLTDIISRALFIFRRPPLEGLFCGANTNGLDFVGFQFVLCLRVLIKEPVSPFLQCSFAAIGMSVFIYHLIITSRYFAIFTKCFLLLIIDYIYVFTFN